MPERDCAGGTTRPSAGTTTGHAALGRGAIRWVHPSTALSVLEDEHHLGRDAACDTVLLGDEVSRRHARIRVRGAFPVITDLGSRNGVFVNGQREKERLLAPGDVVRIGEWVGLVVLLDLGQARPYELTEIADGWYGGPSLLELTERVRRVAPKDLAVVVQGETGAGKEGIARAVHAWSGRAGAFVDVDCGTLPENLAESHLFGHRKGAFTGADREHDGYFRAAARGTLFLDEILNLSLSLQAKLLRAIERREIIPLGDSRPVPVDVRIVCAAQSPLKQAVEAHRFREDLLARLDGFTVVLPPLRERREDVIPLFKRLLAELPGGAGRDLEPRLAEALLLHDWPRNVRGLVGVARHLLAVHDDACVFRRSMLPGEVLEPGPHPAYPAFRRPSAPVDDPDAFEALVSAMQLHGGNVSKAADALGISRSRANRLLDAHPEYDRTRARKERQ
ncbi:MAG TPA: sigma 54-interacting transcriptional regulator [Polyangiaceae bacterium]|nr:sigma 54-interacting transcriptional regulator [Polyangiaceae bacterium]